MHGSILKWFEIPVTDLDRAQRFYERVLDIDLKRETLPQGMELAVFPYNNGVGGALARIEPLRPGMDGTLVYLSAGDDLTAALARVAEHGGAVIRGKTQVTEEIGFIAIFRDSEGNRVALHSPH